MRTALALAACLVPIAAVAFLYTLTPSEPTYTLLGYSEDGNEYVLDSGLTHEDCRKSEYDVRFGYTVCEQEG